MVEADPLAVEYAELLASQKQDPVLFALDEKNLERVMALYNKFMASRSEMRKRTIVTAV